MKTRKFKIDWVRGQLLSGGRVNGMSALNGCGLYRLSSAIHVLRNNGLDITCVHIDNPNGGYYGEYFMTSQAIEDYTKKGVRHAS